MSSTASFAASTGARAGSGRVVLPPKQAHLLVTRAAAGDRKAFESLYRAYLDIVYKYVARRAPHPRVEDLVAEVFVRALKGIGSYQYQGADFSAWLLRIARNLLYDQNKSHALTREIPHEDIPEPRESEAYSTPMDFDLSSLRGALLEIPPAYREVLELRFVEGRSVSDVARMLAKSEGAVRVLQFRALKALRSKLPRD